MKANILLLASWAAQGLAQQRESKVTEAIAYNKNTGFQTDALAASALENIIVDITQRGYPAKDCTLDDVYVRREW